MRYLTRYAIATATLVALASYSRAETKTAAVPSTTGEERLLDSIVESQPPAKNDEANGGVTKYAGKVDIRTFSSENVPELDQTKLQLARKLVKEGNYGAAESLVIGMIKGAGTKEVKRLGYLELAATLKAGKKYGKALQVYSEYLKLFFEHPSVPEIYLEQGLLYREMGLSNKSISKFYAVISGCITVKSDQVDYYERLVIRAQKEIAETYYLEKKYEEASDYLARLLKLTDAGNGRREIMFKLIHCLFSIRKWEATTAKAIEFLGSYETSDQAAEVRYVLAQSLKSVGRNEDAMREVMKLLQTQEQSAKTNPGAWEYWQKRTGKEIAGELAKEGDYLNALVLYQQLTRMEKSPEWQLPLQYQIALLYESLKQEQKAVEIFDQIIAKGKGLEKQEEAAKAIVSMAAWRKDYLKWENRAVPALKEFQPRVEVPAAVADQGKDQAKNDSAIN